MQITFLGTGAGAPSRMRNVSATALHLPERGEMWLFDCGEGTQQQILRAPRVRLSQLTKIFITHLHGDHIFGLLGLLSSRSLAQGGASPVTMYAPVGLDEYLRVSLAVSGTRFAFPIFVETVQAGLVFAEEKFTVHCTPVRHRTTAFAYAVQEHDQPGRFDPVAARALGVPPGPLFGMLKAGETITLPDGREIDGHTLVGEPRPGRKVVFSGDTTFAPELVELAADADLLIHEATYRAADVTLAERAFHSTNVMAAEVARAAGVHCLYLNHISPRYEVDGTTGTEELLAEARAIFPDTHLAYDLLSIEVPRRES